MELEIEAPSAAGHGPRSNRSWRRRLLIGAPILLVLLAIAIGVPAVLIVRSLISEANTGRQELLAGAHLVASSGTALTSAQIKEADGKFRAAEGHFRRANSLLDGFPVNIGRGLPWISTQVNATSQLADLGMHASRAGHLATIAAGALLQPSPSGTQEDPGVKLLRELDVLDPTLVDISAELAKVQSDRDSIPASGLFPNIADAVRQLNARFNVDHLVSLLTTLRGSEIAVRHLVAATGSQTYLVLQQDPAEIRGTGGFIGSVGFLSFDHGKMAPYLSEDIDHIDTKSNGSFVLGGPGSPNHVDPPYPLEHVFHLQSWELRDANWSPDFPTSARQAEFLLNRETGQHVGGVLAIDPYFIEHLLAVTGPVKLPETGDLVDQHNFFALTFNRVELNPNVNRKDFLGQAAKQILAQVMALPTSKWSAVLQAVQASCDSRSLQASFNDQQIQALVDRQHCGGQVRTPSSDALMVVESNIGGNKDDFWLKRRYDLAVEIRPDGSARHVLKLHYDGLSSHGFRLTGLWGYTGWIRVYVPPASSVVSISGAVLNPATDLNRQVLEGWFYVEFDHSTDITIVYDLPADVTGALHRSYQFFWQRQSGLAAVPLRFKITLPPSWQLRSASVGSQQVKGAVIDTDLAVDRQFLFRYD